MGTRAVEALDHTGDAGMLLRAERLDRLFELARGALVDELLAEPPAHGDTVLELELRAPELDRLLRRWLDELLYLLQTRGRVPVASRVELVPEGDGPAGWRLHARLTVAPLDLDAHGWRGEVKGVTYHALELGPEASGWRARIILDV